MSCPMRCFWRAIWLFSLGLFLHCGEARVLTETPVGPLYRVVGSRLSILCNVSGFSDDSTRKEFEFRFTVPGKSSLNVISSKDRSFSYNVYSKRMDAEDITLKHLSPNSVVLEIQSLQKGDEGDFECFVINTESFYNGVYAATTSVKVIDNSLSVSTPVSTELSHTEGEALTLTCQASSNTVQHTHLSVVWYLHKISEDIPRPIISLDRDFTLNPGQGFERRHQAGLIRLDKVGEATYKLKMEQLEVSDEGRIHCQAQEWIQDPDRSWYSITQKDSEKSTLNVKAKEVLPTSFLAVKISVQPTLLLEGQELSLSCNIDAQDLSGKFFSVAWLRGQSELARMGPTGILSVGSEYSVRDKEGELRAARIEERLYRLVLHPVRSEDQGQYSCRAWPLERGQDGGFTEGEAKDSSPEQVIISSTESGLSLDMQNTVRIEEGEKLKLTCKAHGIQGQLSVTWQHRAAATPKETFTDVASLNREGVMEIAAEFSSRKVTAMRPAIDTFTLELDEVTSSDSGVYQCAVSEWKINSKIISQSQRANVTVASTESLAKLKLVTRKSVVTVGENVELMCQVRGLNIPATLTWSLQRDASTIDTILTQYSNGSISWSGEQHHYQLKVEKKNEKEVINYLLINGVTHREAGKYQCRVSVFLKNVHKKLPPSNQLGVAVLKPVRVLTLTSTPTLSININTDIDMKCSVNSNSTTTSRYAVTWLLQQEAENKTILKSDQDAITVFGSQLDQSYRQRISMKRTEGPTFELSIRQTQISDSGSYICEVVEWLQDPHGSWYQLQSVSRTVKLILTEPANDLRLDQRELSLVAKEGDEVKLECNIISGASSSSFFYKVSWLYTGQNSPIPSTLVELDHMGLVRYSENPGLQDLKERLRLLRPNRTSFYLEIQKAHEGDKGTYKCQVELYQLDREGHWQQKASESAGPIMLTVNVPGKNLSVVQENMELNVSISQNFNIPCQITKQSSNESQFQVMWFWHKDTKTKPQPIFAAYRNSTLQTFGKGDRLRFSHPYSTFFTVTLSNPEIDDSGLYFCKVEEWLPSLSVGWRKVAVETSGYLTINVYAKGDAEAVSTFQSGTLTGVLGSIIFCTLLVIIVLVLKICWSKGKENTSKKSLWTEKISLNTKPSAED